MEESWKQWNISQFGRQWHPSVLLQFCDLKKCAKWTKGSCYHARIIFKYCQIIPLSTYCILSFKHDLKAIHVETAHIDKMGK